MTDRQHDSNETDTPQETNQGLSRRTTLKVGGAVGAAGLLAWLTGADLPGPLGGDETTAAAESPEDPVWTQEAAAHREMAATRPTLRLSLVGESVTARTGPNGGPVSAIGAEPTANGAGDRVVVIAEEAWASDLETLLVARFTTGDRVATNEITIEDQSVTIRIFNRDEMWIGIGRYNVPNSSGNADLLLVRSTNRETLQELIATYPDRYDALRPL